MIEDNKYYNIIQLSQAKLHPFDNTREYISNMVNRDYHRQNLLHTIRRPWKSGGGFDYRILGKDYKDFIAMRAYLQ